MLRYFFSATDRESDRAVEVDGTCSLPGTAPTLLPSIGSRPLGVAGRAAVAHGRQGRRVQIQAHLSLRMVSKKKGGMQIDVSQSCKVGGRGKVGVKRNFAVANRGVRRRDNRHTSKVCSFFFSLGVFLLHALSVLLHVIRRGECKKGDAPLDQSVANSGS